MSRQSSWFSVVATLWLVGVSVGEEIDGRIERVDGRVLQITTQSEFLPVAGDRLDIFVSVPGVGEAKVGTATIGKVDGDEIQAQVDNATGRIAAGQSVKIRSAKPVRRAGVKVPPLVGRTGTAAKTAAEAAGLRAKFVIGVPAPADVEPFTVYKQQPGAGEPLVQGGDVVIILYGNRESAAPAAGSGLPALPGAPDAPSNPPPPRDVAVRQRVNRNLQGPREEDGRVAQALIQLFGQMHLSARPLDDAISRRLFDSLVRWFDPGKIYFLQSDIDEFARDRLELDDMLRRGDIRFVYRLYERFGKRVSERVRWAEQLLDAEHDFTVHEEIVLAHEGASFPRSTAEAYERWRKRVKYDLLNETADGEQDLEQAKRKLRRRYRAFEDRIFETSDDDLFSMAMEQLTGAYDPHSGYVSPKKWEDFLIQSKQEMVGIGAALTQTDSGVRVTKLITGGPAQRDGRLKVGDRIVGVGQGAGGETVEVIGMPLADVVATIRGKAGSIVRLQVVSTGAFEANVYEITRAKFDLGKAQADRVDRRRAAAGAASQSRLHLSAFVLSQSVRVRPRRAKSSARPATTCGACSRTFPPAVSNSPFSICATTAAAIWRKVWRSRGCSSVEARYCKPKAATEKSPRTQPSKTRSRGTSRW